MERLESIGNLSYFYYTSLNIGFFKSILFISAVLIYLDAGVAPERIDDLWTLLERSNLVPFFRLRMESWAKAKSSFFPFSIAH